MVRVAHRRRTSTAERPGPGRRRKNEDLVAELVRGQPAEKDARRHAQPAGGLKGRDVGRPRLVRARASASGWAGRRSLPHRRSTPSRPRSPTTTAAAWPPCRRACPVATIGIQAIITRRLPKRSARRPIHGLMANCPARVPILMARLVRQSDLQDPDRIHFLGRLGHAVEEREPAAEAQEPPEAAVGKRGEDEGRG